MIIRTNTRAGRVGRARDKKSRAGPRRRQNGQVSWSVSNSGRSPIAIGASQRAARQGADSKQRRPNRLALLYVYRSGTPCQRGAVGRLAETARERHKDESRSRTHRRLSAPAPRETPWCQPSSVGMTIEGSTRAARRVSPVRAAQIRRRAQSHRRRFTAMWRSGRWLLLGISSRPERQPAAGFSRGDGGALSVASRCPAVFPRSKTFARVGDVQAGPRAGRRSSYGGWPEGCRTAQGVDVLESVRLVLTRWRLECRTAGTLPSLSVSHASKRLARLSDRERSDFRHAARDSAGGVQRSCH